MILYRARRLSDRQTRIPAYQGNEPAVRARGRWFTSVMADAVAHGASNHADGTWELVSIKVDDAFVDTFRVATTPRTRCGLSPIDYAISPETEYLVQSFRAHEAVRVAMNDRDRIRDYILIGSTAPYGSRPNPVPVALPVAA